MDIEFEPDEVPAERSVKGQIREKWGSTVDGGGLTGFLAIPEVLIRSQKRLQLTSTEMMVLINILMHWWYADTKPFPGNYAIANRMGVSRRTVQRAIRSMEKKGLMKSAPMVFTKDDRPRDNAMLESLGIDAEEEEALETPYSSVREIDLSGLVSRLENECAVSLRDFNLHTEVKAREQ